MSVDLRNKMKIYQEKVQLFWNEMLVLRCWSTRKYFSRYILQVTEKREVHYISTLKHVAMQICSIIFYFAYKLKFHIFTLLQCSSFLLLLLNWSSTKWTETKPVLPNVYLDKFSKNSICLVKRYFYKFDKSNVKSRRNCILELGNSIFLFSRVSHTNTSVYPLRSCNTSFKLCRTTEMELQISFSRGSFNRYE